MPAVLQAKRPRAKASQCNQCSCLVVLFPFPLQMQHTQDMHCLASLAGFVGQCTLCDSRTAEHRHTCNKMANASAAAGAKSVNIEAPVADNPTVYAINTAVLALAAGLAATNPQLVRYLIDDNFSKPAATAAATAQVHCVLIINIGQCIGPRCVSWLCCCCYLAPQLW